MIRFRLAMIPAIIIVIASLVLVVSGLLSKPVHDREKYRASPPVSGTVQGTQEHFAKDGSFKRDETGSLFKLGGNIAIAAGTVSFWWLLFKKKLASRSKPVKAFAKLLYKFHIYAGWTALGFVVIHGTYYLLTDIGKPAVRTGIAAFLILACLGVYGWMYRRWKNKTMRKIHGWLAYLWIAAIAIHGGGFVFAAALVTAALAAVVWVMDRRAGEAYETLKSL